MSAKIYYKPDSIVGVYTDKDSGLQYSIQSEDTNKVKHTLNNTYKIIEYIKTRMGKKTKEDISNTYKNITSEPFDDIKLNIMRESKKNTKELQFD